DAVKAANRKKHGPLNDYASFGGGSDAEMFFKVGFCSADPEGYILAAEERTLLNDRLRTVLTAREFKVLEGFMQGLSYGEIGAAAGINIKAVDNSLQSIRRKMRKKL
ncbi:MAG: LuxR C-terminal-related transcriptional regulator, partial [Clostridiales bacterium]|nr:LuxR C-terminal-related transcriptional regulator [Clostridiales bacterium]